MKTKALTNIVVELSEAKVLVELKDGTVLPATGFVVRRDTDGNSVIIIKAAKTKTGIKIIDPNEETE